MLNNTESVPDNGAERVRFSSCIDAIPTTLKDVFGGQVKDLKGKLNLPVYQRPYCWGEKQVRQLVGDLDAYFSLNSDVAFYLGSIVLHQHENDQGEVVLDIIDGQQRLTTMAILCKAWGQQPILDLTYRAPASHERIRRNFSIVEKMNHIRGLGPNLGRINVTLIVTRSEDDAWRFFQTMNTGGRRLSGTDIIKAHHLRAIASGQRDHYARLWEKTGTSLDDVIKLLIAGRFWTDLNVRKFYWSELRNEIIAEFGDDTQPSDQDPAYRLSVCQNLPSGLWQQFMPECGYAMRQPLNSGVNTINYLLYFCTLHHDLFPRENPDGGAVAENAHEQLEATIINAAESRYLRALYETAILLYASRFGQCNLAEARLWLLRFVFSLRLTKLRVFEQGVQKLCLDHRILDHIASSFNHAQLMQYLRAYTYDIDTDGLDGGGVRARYVRSVYGVMGQPCPDKEPLKNRFDDDLIKHFGKLTDSGRAA
ncbi:DUF262 domain-containing protein [Komagataeibacter swingsii]|uniref:Uncharacterized protein n=1 Tax=Komagataeibacter swingsii TaxID=215220 RepID=A0A2V4R3Y8_9PROT|nr:DUF262 domain-containing protein [Komagataeibacter swingsii]PYD70617.1 hypothetical protein CFR76_04500 [Komagataeibacter swingsii]GBQ58882.1 hypothetical protein AA16373_1397 [Komagataeibacter swingsii DSM 16373]